MDDRRRGFSLLEVMIALSVLALGTVVMLQLALGTTRSVSIGRRWTAMAWAADNELVRLERDFRAARPGCLPPPGGSRYTADGVGLDWSVAGDSVRIRVVVAARAVSRGRVLADSVATTLSCR